MNDEFDKCAWGPSDFSSKAVIYVYDTLKSFKERFPFQYLKRKKTQEWNR